MKVILYIVFFLAIGMSTRGQSADTLFLPVPVTPEDVGTIYRFLESPPPLDLVVHYAELYSPVLKYQDELIKKNEFQLKRSNKAWLDMFQMSATGRWGNYGNEAVNQVELGYGMGGSIRFSLFDVTGQRAQAKVFAQEIKLAKHKKDELIQELQHVVTVYYHDLMMTQSLLKVRSDGKQAATLHVEMAQKEFTEGEIPVSELARVTEILAKAAADFEVTLNDFNKNYKALEALVGISLMEIKSITAQK